MLMKHLPPEKNTAKCRIQRNFETEQRSHKNKFQTKEKAAT